jgi:hypothetical protein
MLVNSSSSVIASIAYRPPAPRKRPSKEEQGRETKQPAQSRKGEDEGSRNVPRETPWSVPLNL